GRQAISRGEGWEHGLVLGRERTLPLLDELHVVAGSPVKDRLLHPLRQRLAVVRGTCPRGCDRGLVQRKRCLPTHTAHHTAARKALVRSLPCAPAADGSWFVTFPSGSRGTRTGWPSSCYRSVSISSAQASRRAHKPSDRPEGLGEHRRVKSWIMFGRHLKQFGTGVAPVLQHTVHVDVVTHRSSSEQRAQLVRRRVDWMQHR